MQNLLSDLTHVLEQDERLVSDGALLKNKIVELALMLDSGLIKLLLKNALLRGHFFVEVEGILVFDKIKFQRFVSNKQFLPDSYTSFKNKIGLTARDEFLSAGGDVVLSWPYKDCVLEGGQTKADTKRTEVFWNETLAPDQIDRLLAPKVLTNFRRITAGVESEVSKLETSESMVIKGNNLLALHTLQPRYLNAVKLIYLDPPYNTGNDDFQYNDAFAHSTWLTFMRSRLLAAKALLRTDGVIAISIDHNEAFHLKVLCDELFGRQNFLSCITVQNNPKGRVMDKNFSTSHEYLLFYSKNKLPLELTVRKTDEELKRDYKEVDDDGFLYRSLELRNTHREYGKHNRPKLYFPLYVNESDASVSTEKSGSDQVAVLPVWEDGFDGCWTWSKTKCNIEAELLIGRRVKGSWKVFRMSYASSESGENVSKKLKTIWMSKDFHTEKGQKTLDAMIGKGRFRSPKPVGFIKTLVDLVTDSHAGDIVVDCFGGSGTTAHAIFELNKEDGGNRAFVLSEQLDYVNTTTLDRLKAAQVAYDAPAFTYCELAPGNAAMIARIDAAQTTPELFELWSRMQADAFLSYKADARVIQAANEALVDLPLAEQKRFLWEVLDKNMLYVPLSEMDDTTYGISDGVKALNHQFFRLS